LPLSFLERKPCPAPYKTTPPMKSVHYLRLFNRPFGQVGVTLKRFAFILNHFDRRTRLFPKLCLGDQSDALTQIERETL
jgi:hypothetical protein